MSRTSALAPTCRSQSGYKRVILSAPEDLDNAEEVRFLHQRADAGQYWFFGLPNGLSDHPADRLVTYFRVRLANSLTI